MKQHEVQAQMDAYLANCDRERHPGFDAQEFVNMQIARADAPKEKWYKRLM